MRVASLKSKVQQRMITKKISKNGCGSSCGSLYIFKNINRGQPLLAKRALVFGWKIPLLAIYESLSDREGDRTARRWYYTGLVRRELSLGVEFSLFWKMFPWDQNHLKLFQVMNKFYDQIFLNEKIDRRNLMSRGAQDACEILLLTFIIHTKHLTLDSYFPELKCGMKYSAWISIRNLIP